MTSWVPFDLLDHLWQSTLFAAAIWLITRAVRANAARVRYWLWFAASVKFLVPLSVLVSIGERFAWRTTPAPAPAVAAVIEQVLTPAAATVATVPAAPIASSPALWPILLLVVWGVGVLLVLAQWWQQWKPIRRALQDARPADLGGHEGVTVRASASMIEPGVFGIVRPVLLVPEGIGDRLTPAQLRALIAHERCHIRHHDNLTASLHMAVEALFWFHPLVWWLERRLIEERERACDEYVLQSGSTPRDYAEGILEVCRFAKDPSPVFVAGITGADLRRRIESILRNETARPLGISRALALAACCALAGLGPVAAGAANAVPLITVGQDPSTPVAFEVASVKPNRSGERSAQIDDNGPGGRFTATNVPLKRLVTYAYQISDNQLVSAPGWIADERFDITARLDHEPPAVQRWEAGERRLALRTLLAGRFNLIVKRETREFPMYALVMARPDGRPGPKLTPSATDCSPEGLKARLTANQAGQAVSGRCGSQFNTGRIRFGGYPMSEFAKVFSYNDRNVIDRTGLTGNWDLDLTFLPDELPPGQDPPAIDPNAASLPAAIQEQLGLKLEPTKGLMEVLVVERVERPTEN
jgi:uncharacterized protein (TIGR03435 family)